MPLVPDYCDSYYRLGLTGIGKSHCIAVYRYDGVRYLINSKGDGFGTRQFRCASSRCKIGVALTASDGVHTQTCDSCVSKSELRLSVGRYILASALLSNPNLNFSTQVNWRQEKTPFVDENEYGVLKMFVDYWSVPDKRSQLKACLEQKMAVAESLLAIYLDNVRQDSQVDDSSRSSDDSNSDSEVSSGDETIPSVSPVPPLCASEPPRKRTSIEIGLTSSSSSSSDGTLTLEPCEMLVSSRRMTRLRSKTITERLTTSPQSVHSLDDDVVHHSSDEGKLIIYILYLCIVINIIIS